MIVEGSNPANHGGGRARQQRLFKFLQSCKTIKHLTQIHSQIITNRFTQKNFIIGKLLSLCIIFNKLSYASKVFEFAQNPSTILWNQIIRAHANGEKPRFSVIRFREMIKFEALPDAYTYSFVVNGCAKGVLISEGEQIHAKILRIGYCSDVFVQTNLVNFYSVCEGIESAEKVFDEMSERNVVAWNSMISGYFRRGKLDDARRVFDEMPERNVVSWTAMIAGYARNERCEEALSVFREMWRSNVEFDQVTLISVLSTCAEMGFLELGRWIHSYVLESSSAVLVSLNNALIHMYSSCGEIEDAYEVFNRMPERNSVSWTSMITGFAKQGYADEALGLFRNMTTSKPDDITLLGVLCACSHAGYVDQGRVYFKSMKDKWGLEPKIQHYGCMVDLLSRAGLLDEAMDLIEAMPMDPNNAVWGALLGGCRIHNNAALASGISRKLIFELEPERSVGYLVLLKNLYAADKRWHEAVETRGKMVETGARKPPGLSSVQVYALSCID